MIVRNTFLIFLSFCLSLNMVGQNAWINEFHYDDDGSDDDEMFEIVIENPGNYSLSDFTVTLYNGSTGTAYGSVDLDDFIVGASYGTYTVYSYTYGPANSIQNGAPDGFALDYNGSVIQFISYEGSFTALAGIANGLTSTDVGKSETNSTSNGYSIQLSGTGSQYSDFTWQDPAPETTGTANNSQTISGANLTPTKLAFHLINGGINPTTNQSFDVIIEAQDGGGTARSVVMDTDISLSLNSGSGNLSGTLTGTISSGSHSVAISGLKYNIAESGVSMNVFRTSGDSLTAGISSTFTVDPFETVIITEVMPDPASVSDSDGEWFEIYNPTSSMIDIDGWIISDDDGEIHTINNGASLTISSYGFLVLGRNMNSASNGDLVVDYQYSGLTLTNSADELIIKDAAGVEKDRVDYTVSWPNSSGKSMVYIGSINDDNNDITNWAESTSTENYGAAGSDFGSPGVNGSLQGLGNPINTTVSQTGDWDDPSTWSNGVPGPSTDVILDSGTITIDNNAVCDALILSAGAQLTLSNGSELEVGGDFTMEADASELSSFVAEDGSSMNVRGITTIENYLTSGAWHFVSAPVVSATSNVYNGIYLKWYDEDLTNGGGMNDNWVNISATTHMLSPMQGFAAWNQNAAGVFNYTGTLLTGSQGIGLTYTSGEGEGFNLVGNPYPSYIDIEDITIPATMNSSFYFWNALAGNYAYYIKGTGGSGSQYIPPKQGFFVQCTAADTFSIDNSVRDHGSQGFYKSQKPYALNIQVKGNTDYYDQFILVENSDATTEFDGNYDAAKLYGVLEAPQIYSVDGCSNKMAINSVPPVTESYVFPLYLEVGDTGQYTMIINELNILDVDLKVFLEDKEQDSLIEMNLYGAYSFGAAYGDYPERFLVHFVRSQSGVNEIVEPGIHSYAYDSRIYVTNMTNDALHMEVFSLQGKLMFHTEIAESGLFSYHLNVAPGCYITRLSGTNAIRTYKVFLK